MTASEYTLSLRIPLAFLLLAACSGPLDSSECLHARTAAMSADAGRGSHAVGDAGGRADVYGGDAASRPPVGSEGEPFTIAVMADAQYADVATHGRRQYRDSLAKLTESVADCNERDLAFVVQLGDAIDRDAGSFAPVQEVFDDLRAPLYHVLGNHDYEVDDAVKAQVPELLGMPAPYHAVTRPGWRFLILDGNDVSTYAHPAGSDALRRSLAYRAEQAPDAPEWNGAIGAEQLAWLEDQLDEAEEAGERVVLFCHFPLRPADTHVLWNADEVLAVLDRHPNVVAWINGHNHRGGYVERNGVHHLTMHGMVDTDDNAYAFLRFTEQTLEVDGVGREEDRCLVLP